MEGRYTTMNKILQKYRIEFTIIAYFTPDATLSHIKINGIIKDVIKEKVTREALFNYYTSRGYEVTLSPGEIQFIKATKDIKEGAGLFPDTYGKIQRNITNDPKDIFVAYYENNEQSTYFIKTFGAEHTDYIINAFNKTFNKSLPTLSR